MISGNAKYWIWLTIALGYNNPRYKKLYDLYGSAEVLYRKGEPEWILSGILSGDDIAKLHKTQLEQAEKVVESCVSLGYRIVTIEDDTYPADLQNIYSPPAVLYIEGQLPNFSDTLSVAVVGTRQASSYGVKTAYEIAYNLSKHGVVVISGGALGVDCASHNGVLQADGVTVCVLGCGIHYNYLAENKQMRKNIAHKGAVVSEYPPDTKPMPYYFPARNRIISGLSKGVLVIEAGLKSGSLITANLALEQGKDVFAVMANINSIQSKGSNRLIKDGAVPVASYTDIIEYYFPEYEAADGEGYVSTEEEIDLIPVKKVKTNQTKKSAQHIPTSKNYKSENSTPVHKTVPELSELAGSVYYKLNNTPVHIDELSVCCGMPVFQVLQALTELEIMGLIECLKGRYYKII